MKSFYFLGWGLYLPEWGQAIKLAWQQAIKFAETYERPNNQARERNDFRNAMTEALERPSVRPTNTEAPGHVSAQSPAHRSTNTLEF